MPAESQSGRNPANEQPNEPPPLTPYHVKYKRLSSSAVSLVTCVVLYSSFKITYSEANAFRYSGSKSHNESNETSAEDIILLVCNGVPIDDELLSEQRTQIVILTVTSLAICIGGLAIVPILMKLCKRSSRREDWQIYWRGHTKLYSIWEFLMHSLLLLATYSSVPYSYCGNDNSHNVFYKNFIFKVANAFECTTKELIDQKFCMFGTSTWTKAMWYSNYAAGALSLYFSLMTIKHAWCTKLLCFSIPCSDLITRLSRIITTKFRKNPDPDRRNAERNVHDVSAMSMIDAASSGSGDRRNHRSQSHRGSRSRRNSPSPVYNPYTPRRSPSYRAHHPQRDEGQSMISSSHF